MCDKASSVGGGTPVCFETCRFIVEVRDFFLTTRSKADEFEWRCATSERMVRSRHGCSTIGSDIDARTALRMG